MQIQRGSQSMERMVSIRSTPVQGRKLSFSVGWVGLVYRFQGDRGACLASCILCCLRNGPILRTRRKKSYSPGCQFIHTLRTPLSAHSTPNQLLLHDVRAEAAGTAQLEDEAALALASLVDTRLFKRFRFGLCKAFKEARHAVECADRGVRNV